MLCLSSPFPSKTPWSRAAWQEARHGKQWKCRTRMWMRMLWEVIPRGLFLVGIKDPGPCRDTTPFRIATTSTYVGRKPLPVFPSSTCPGWSQDLPGCPLAFIQPPLSPVTGAAGHSARHEPDGGQGAQLCPDVRCCTQPVIAYGQSAPPRWGE